MFPLGPAVQDEIITTNRLILILKGKLDYTIEGRSTRMVAGMQFLVPAWTRRVWSVPCDGPCEIVWCEFDEMGKESGWSNCRLRTLTRSEFAREREKYQELLNLQKQEKLSDEAWALMLLEVELKAMILRFLQKSEDTRFGRKTGFTREREAPRPIHPKVKIMLRWLGDHFTEKDVLVRLYREAGMSRNYFRTLFVEAMQCPPQRHIEQLRLRHARFLLHDVDWPLKQIADACGYRGALHFSKIYRRFWGHPPGKERSGS